VVRSGSFGRRGRAFWDRLDSGNPNVRWEIGERRLRNRRTCAGLTRIGPTDKYGILFPMTRPVEAAGGTHRPVVPRRGLAPCPRLPAAIGPFRRLCPPAPAAGPWAISSLRCPRCRSSGSRGRPPLRLPEPPASARPEISLSSPPRVAAGQKPRFFQGALRFFGLAQVFAPAPTGPAPMSPSGRGFLPGAGRGVPPPRAATFPPCPGNPCPRLPLSPLLSAGAFRNSAKLIKACPPVFPVCRLRRSPSPPGRVLGLGPRIGLPPARPLGSHSLLEQGHHAVFGPRPGAPRFPPDRGVREVAFPRPLFGPAPRTPLSLRASKKRQPFRSDLLEVRASAPRAALPLPVVCCENSLGTRAPGKRGPVFLPPGLLGSPLSPPPRFPWPPARPLDRSFLFRAGGAGL